MIALQKYRITGVDCANCAAKIEARLQSLPGLQDSRMSFATETLYLDPAQLDRAREVVDSLEPGAQVLEAGTTATSPDSQTSPTGQSGTSAPVYESGQSGLPAFLSRIPAPATWLAGLVFTLGMVFYDSLVASPGSWALWAVFVPVYLLVGIPVLGSALRNLLRGRVFDEYFLMSIATLGAFAIGEVPEAAAVMLFWSVGEALQNRAVDRSRRSIKALLDLKPETARVLETRDFQAGVKKLPPEAVEPGTWIQVLPGERIPLDGRVLQGESDLDTSSLTGESLPRRAKAGQEVLAGFINGGGLLVVEVLRLFSQSSAARILDLVENAASRKSPTEKFISRFAAVYTPLVVLGALILAFVPPLVLPGQVLAEWVHRALVMLVISCPCALVISIPLGYFGGIGKASRSHILVKGGEHLDALTQVHTLVLDKTGTLTEGRFQVRQIQPRAPWTTAELLRWAAAAEQLSTHPIGRSLVQAAGAGQPSSANADGASTITGLPPVAEVQEFRGLGLRAQVDGRTVLVGNGRLMAQEGIAHDTASLPGSVVHVALDGTYAGWIQVADALRPEALAVLQEVRSLGVREIHMLTGDVEGAAAPLAAELKLEGYRAGLLPEDKVTELERMKAALPPGRRIAFVGDGMNDAPVLMASDLGLAMGDTGSAAALEAADLVLAGDHLDRIPQALRIARFTRRVVLQNIALAIVVKGAFLTLGALGLAGMTLAVLGDVGVALLAVINSLRTLGQEKGSS